MCKDFRHFSLQIPAKHGTICNRNATSKSAPPSFLAMVG
jgi:hypothetical protein